MSPQNQHLTQAMLRKPATTRPKQFQTTWCFGKDGQHAGGAGDLESATVFQPLVCLGLRFGLRLAVNFFILRLKNRYCRGPSIAAMF
jgi:hypothetical protein